MRGLVGEEIDEGFVADVGAAFAPGWFAARIGW